MIANGKPPTRFAGCNERLLNAVPTSARRILEVGCGAGHLGAALKKLGTERRVFGVELISDAAASAASRLDEVFAIDIEYDDPPLDQGSLDCILLGDVLQHLVAPDRVLIRLRRFLASGGTILCSVPNVQHHSIIAGLLRSDFQYTEAGLLDSTHLRFFTYSTLIKLFSDCGFEPEIVDTTVIPAPSEFLKAVEPLQKHLDLNPSRTQRYLEAYQYIVKGTLESDHCIVTRESQRTERPLSFVCCVSNNDVLQANFLSSLCLRNGTLHEVLLMPNCRSAAEGLNQGIARAKHDMVVCLHQDVYLPDGWPERFWQQVKLSERRHGPAGVYGVYGIVRRGAWLSRAGHVIDRDHILHEPEALPTIADTLDELLLAIPKKRAAAFDPSLGFHFYGADYCLSCGTPAVVIDALCFHNSVHVGVSPQFHESARVFTRKWSGRLPLATPSALIDIQGNMSAA
jgi:SAM-dependent methyltransferase